MNVPFAMCVKRGMVGVQVAMLGCSVFAAGSNPGDKKDAKALADQMVDSGSFSVSVHGQRVMTETFTVEQRNGASVVLSRLQEAGAASGIHQKSELQMTSSGGLIRYDWSDGNESLSVTPKDDFLLEKITLPPSPKPAEKPFLMPSTSAILDNNFFIHREILAWRYLATNCHNDGSTLKCQQGPVEFGVLVPQDSTSMPVRMELVGREKILLHGSERELMRLNLKGESFSWAIWVDDKDHFKVMRVQIPSDDTEAVRE